jgi:hypothetical protein
MSRNRVFITFCACSLLAALSSCGLRSIGYGVILWGDPSGPVATGKVVSILQHSQIESTYIAVFPGERTPRVLSESHVRFFPRRGEAEAFAKSFAQYLTTWAFSTKEDPPPLPIREKPAADAKTIYRLKPGQMVKILSRSERKEAIKPYEDYWYEVATDDGSSGWCFGHYLKVFTAQGDPAMEAGAIMSQDEVLDKILGSTWRPSWFQDMIATGMIDLARLREDIGFFPNPAENVFHLVLPSYSLDFPYQRIERVAAGSYSAVGSDLRISVLDESRIAIRYPHKNQTVEGLYTVVQDDIAEVISREQKRRQDIYDALMARGSTLTSSAYGTIRLQGGMRFSWEGFNKLVPAVIGAGAAGAGAIDFPYHTAKALAGTYDGVITFLFDDPSGAFGAPRRPSSSQSASAAAGAVIQGVSFLYSSSEGGLRFTSLSEESFRDISVTRPGFSPVNVFFTQSGSP